MKPKNSNDTMGNRTRELPVYSVVPYPLRHRNSTVGKTPVIRINWDPESSGYSENQDNWIFIVCFLLGNSPASECYMPTFRNTLSVRSSFLKPSHSSYLLAYEDGTKCSETSANEIQTPENYPEESTQRLEHGESLRSRIGFLLENRPHWQFVVWLLPFTVCIWV
jgi:hypothetical protein